MILEYTKAFEKQFAKLDNKRQTKVLKTIDLFVEEPSHPMLRNHNLRGQFKGTRSISASGDMRLHFQVYITANKTIFTAVGTHSQLYK